MPQIPLAAALSDPEIQAMLDAYADMTELDEDFEAWLATEPPMTDEEIAKALRSWQAW